MADSIDFFNKYIMGSAEMLFGFFCYVKMLHKRVRLWFYLLFAACAVCMVRIIPSGTMIETGAYILLLAAGGKALCHTDKKSALLYAALVVEIMQLSHGIVNSLSSVVYPLMSCFDQNRVGMIFMFSGYVVSLLSAGLCCHMVRRYFFCCETIEKQYMFLILIPLLMIFTMDEYIHSSIYSMVVTDGSGVMVYTNHYQMLIIQFLGMASLFCVLAACKKLARYFRISTELSLLEQEEHSLRQYVDEAKARYEKTKSFRHDIRNHIAVIKKLLQTGREEQALDYIRDMEDMSEELSFPCSTNNPVVDILAGNKLGIAKSMGIDVCCRLLLPYPCGVRDIDLCIILSNALDNAVCACKNMDGAAEKYIRISGRIQGDFLLMEIENSFQGRGMLREGTGLSNVRAVAEKYHGAMSIKTQGTVFVLHVMLIIPQHSEDIPRQMD